MRLSVSLWLLLAGQSAAPQGITAQVAAGSAAAAARGQPRFVLDPGASIQVYLPDSSIVVGTVLIRFVPDSEQLIICTAKSCAASDSGDIRIVRAADIARLSVWGNRRGPYALLGLYGGALVGGLVGGKKHSTAFAVGGGLGLATLGGILGSRTPGWELVQPCYHACASGSYPR